MIYDWDGDKIDVIVAEYRTCECPGDPRNLRSQGSMERKTELWMIRLWFRFFSIFKFHIFLDPNFVLDLRFSKSTRVFRTKVFFRFGYSPGLHFFRFKLFSNSKFSEIIFVIKVGFSSIFVYVCSVSPIHSFSPN